MRELDAPVLTLGEDLQVESDVERRLVGQYLPDPPHVGSDIAATVARADSVDAGSSANLRPTRCRTSSNVSGRSNP